MASWTLPNPQHIVLLALMLLSLGVVVCDVATTSGISLPGRQCASVVPNTTIDAFTFLYWLLGLASMILAVAGAASFMLGADGTDLILILSLAMFVAADPVVTACLNSSSAHTAAAGFVVCLGGLIASLIRDN